MPSKERAIQDMLATQREQLRFSVWTKQSYAQRKRDLLARLLETQTLLDRLEASHAAADGDAAVAEREITRLERELAQAKYGDKLQLIERLRAQIAGMARKGVK